MGRALASIIMSEPMHAPYAGRFSLITGDPSGARPVPLRHHREALARACGTPEDPTSE